MKRNNSENWHSSRNSIPKVSVLSVFCNRESYVEASVKSIISQEDIDFEAIIIDDFSSDQTYEKLLSVCGSNENIHVVRNSINIGFVNSIRLAASLARGNYIAIHGSGDISLPKRLNTQAHFLDTHQDIVLVGCSYIKSKDFSEFFIEDFAVKKASEIQTTPQIIIQPWNKLLVHNPFSHGEIMFRRSAYESCGGYRSNFYFAQDRDLLLRISTLGDFAIIQDTLYVRKYLPDSVSRSYKKLALQKVYSALACQLFLQRLKQGYDILDTIGSGGNIALRSRASIKPLLILGLRASVDGQHQSARFIFKLANYHGSIFGYLFCTALDVLLRHIYPLKKIAIYAKMKKHGLSVASWTSFSS